LHGTPPEHWAKEVLGRKRMNLFDLSCAYLDRKLINSSRCRILLPVSKLVEDCYRKHYDLSRKTIKVVNPTVSDEFVNPPPSLFDWRERLDTPKNAKVILFIANNYSHKGLDLIMDAVQEILKTQDVYLWVGGRGNVPKYEARAIGLGIIRKIRFIGMITENLPHLYRSSNLFVLPSKFDTFGIVIIEALASGLSVITSPFVGSTSLRSNPVNVPLFTILEEKNFSEQIGKELFSTRDKSKQAKSIFKEFFTPSDICDFYES
jgi:UDP-glucose:(heptosyl)LPS alpha-1,3-glucosyltransferase